MVAQHSRSATVIGEGQVIPGWDTGLVGQTVGSRVMLVIPPADGYGSAGDSQAGIKGTDTLVFVVDILAAAYAARIPPRQSAGSAGSSGLPPAPGFQTAQDAACRPAAAARQEVPRSSSRRGPWSTGRPGSRAERLRPGRPPEPDQAVARGQRRGIGGYARRPRSGRAGITTSAAASATRP